MSGLCHGSYNGTQSQACVVNHKHCHDANKLGYSTGAGQVIAFLPVAFVGDRTRARLRPGCFPLHS